MGVAVAGVVDGSHTVDNDERMDDVSDLNNVGFDGANHLNDEAMNDVSDMASNDEGSEFGEETPLHEEERA